MRALTTAEQAVVVEYMGFAEWVVRRDFRASPARFADDLVGEAMVALCGAVVSYDQSRGKIRRWIRRWVKTACHEAIRRIGQRAKVPRGARDLPRHDQDREDAIDSVREKIPEIRKALTDREWAVLASVSGIEGDQKTGAELAEQAGVTRAAISLVVVRAKKKAAVVLGIANEKE